MYDARFQLAKNFDGKLYRNQKTGDLEQCCGHEFLIYPEWGVESKIIASALSYGQEVITEFAGLCKLCGEVIIIPIENIMGKEEFDEEIKKVVVEIGNGDSQLKQEKEAGNGISNNSNLK